MTFRICFLATARQLLALFALACVYKSCSAQQHVGSDSLAPFNSRQRDVLERLSSLGRLPDEPWQMHAGDVPHGEDPNLNTKDWVLAKMPLDTGDGPVWFRRWLTIPSTLHGYSLKGAEVAFQFGAFAHGGIQEIVYFNGRRVALGESLEPISLVNDAHPGDRILIAVKLLHSSGGKHVTSANLPVTPSTARPNPPFIKDECISAGNLLPVLVSAPQELAADEAKLASAVTQINVGALETQDNASFDESLRQAQSTLEQLRPTLSKARMLLIGQSHIDAAWLWPWTETVDAVRRTFFTTLQLMDEYPSFRYTQSAMQYYAWMEEKYPDIFAEIKKRIQEGRWEVVGGMWVEPDFNMPDGETTVRELLLGKRYAKEHLGVDVTVGWNPDSFGYSWQLPQMYRKAGISSFMTEKMSWNETGALPLKLFWWEAPDGSKVLTYLGRSQNASFQVAPLVTDLKTMHSDAPGKLIAMQNYGVGDHGGGVTRSMLDAAEPWTSGHAVFPQTTFSTAGDFFRKVAPLVESPDVTWNYRTLAADQTSLPAPVPGHIEIPTWKDELYLEFHRGTYTTQAHHKRHMRESEEQLLDAEKLSSLAWLDGRPYPAASLTEAWKKATFNGFHDLAAGSGTANVYIDAERDFDSIRQVTGEATRGAMEEIAARADTSGSGTPVVIFNTLSWNRTASVGFDVQLDPRQDLSEGVRVLDPRGRELPVQILSRDMTTGRMRLLTRVQAPSTGFVVLHVSPGKPSFESKLHVTATSLENQLLRVEVDPANGCITHVIDKETGYDSIAPGGCGNQLQTFHDDPKKYDAWNIDADALETMKPIASVDSVRVVETGPLRASLRVTRHWGSSKFVQDIVLDDDSDQVDITNAIDWHETHVLLKAAFPLAASSDHATYEIPYGTIDRPTTRRNPIEKAKFEVPALRWADVGDGHHGLTLLNDSKYGYDAVNNVLRLSLLRSPVYPDPNADRGEQHFRFALYPHPGTWQQAMSMRRGWEYNYPLLSLSALPHYGELGSEHSFVRVQDDAVIVTAIKRQEDGEGLTVRVYDWSGKASHASIQLPGTPKSAFDADLLEKPTDGATSTVALNGRTMDFQIAPYEIKTIVIRY